MPNILILDIETCPFEAYTWGLWDQTVGLEQIKSEWSILAYAAKWLGKDKIMYNDTSGKGAAEVRNDAPLLKEIWDLLDESDLIIAQNGNRFDIRKINARLIMEGYGPYSPIRVIDTLSVAKKHFGFSSNKLAWMSKYLTDTPKSDHRKFPGFELWIECLADNAKAWAEMKKYNIQDTRACEQLYLKLRPWITNHPNIALYNDDATSVCPKCGSEELERRGTAATQLGKYQRYQCKSCAAWSRGKTNLASKNKRKELLV